MFRHPLSRYIAGPLIGLMVPALLLLGNKPFGISGNFRHLCAAAAPCRIEFFGHDGKRLGLWNLTFLSGIFAGAADRVALRATTGRDALIPYGDGAAAAPLVGAGTPVDARHHSERTRGHVDLRQSAPEAAALTGGYKDGHKGVMR